MAKLIDAEELKRILADTDYDISRTLHIDEYGADVQGGYTYQRICDIVNFMPAADAVTYDDLRRLLESDI